MMPRVYESGPRRHAGRHGRLPDWTARLPGDWRDAVAAPLYFRQHAEYEMAAERIQGFDEDNACCYLAHTVREQRMQSDDDEDFYLALIWREEMHAWRLRDGRWLIHRLVQTGEEGGRAFYSFSETMPR
jgi:hypothetical protein